MKNQQHGHYLYNILSYSCSIITFYIRLPSRIGSWSELQSNASVSRSLLCDVHGANRRRSARKRKSNIKRWPLDRVKSPLYYCGHWSCGDRHTPGKTIFKGSNLEVPRIKASTCKLFNFISFKQYFKQHSIKIRFTMVSELEYAPRKGSQGK